jgi:hypothetical protein
MQMRAEKVTDSTEIKEVIRQTFTGDDELFEKYALINGDEDAAINDNCYKVLSLIDNNEADFYKLIKSNQLVGYISVAPKLSTVHSFGLNIKHRNEQNKIEIISGYRFQCL